MVRFGSLEAQGSYSSANVYFDRGSNGQEKKDQSKDDEGSDGHIIVQKVAGCLRSKGAESKLWVSSKFHVEIDFSNAFVK